MLAASSCFGLLLAGRGRWQGWAVGLATQPVWAWFAIVTKSYGLLLVGLMYTAVYAKNLWKWHKDAKKRNYFFEHDPYEPIGEITSVKETDEGLSVRGRFYDDFRMPEIDPPLDASIYSPSEIEWMAANPSINVNRNASSYSFQKDFENWQRDKDVHGTEDGSPDFTRRKTNDG